MKAEKSIEECINLTEELIAFIKNANAETRETIIQKVEELLEQRAALLPFIKKPFTEKEHALGGKLQALNQEMDQLLKNVHLTIQKDINELERKRKTVKRYSNPYGTAEQLDGFFYDKRK